MIQIENRPPHDDTHTACDTPNPPWWCNDAPDATIDDYILILLAVAMIIGILITLYPLIRRKSILKDLTGLYFHKKTTNGNFIIVEYLGENNVKKYRTASNEDIQILKTLNLL